MSATATHQVTVTDQVTATSPQRAEFEFDRSKGEAFYVEVTPLVDGEQDIDGAREFGPFLLVDASVYGQNASTLSDPMAAMVRLARLHEKVNYPGNDWTGLLPATLKN